VIEGCGWKGEAHGKRRRVREVEVERRLAKRIEEETTGRETRELREFVFG
jgi:hypothetical protein